jgi:hypothetical protein
MAGDPSPRRPFDRRRWFTPRALVAHAALIIWVPGCAIASWWQVGIGLSGDSLGWIYSVMWPCFALFGTVFWWHFVHDDPDSIGRRGLRRIQEATALESAGQPGRVEPDVREIALARAEAEDPELAEYNAYLAALARDSRPGSRRDR